MCRLLAQEKKRESQLVELPFMSNINIPFCVDVSVCLLSSGYIIGPNGEYLCRVTAQATFFSMNECGGAIKL